MFRKDLLLLAVLITGLAACDQNANSQNRPRSAPVYQVQVHEVTSEPFNETLSATGTLLANEYVEIQSERPGLVTEIGFQEGQPVKAGQVLVSIDDTELQAEVTRAESRMKLETSTEERQRGLLERRGISVADYDESIANLNIARAELGLIRAQLAKSTIRAPFDGTPGLREISIGSFLTPGTRITSFQDTSSLKVDFSVPERYFPFVQNAKTIRFRVAGRGDLFEGSIYAIEPGIDTASRSVMLRARVPNPDGRLQPGQFAEIDVVLSGPGEAIFIPSIALIPGLKEQRVLILEDGKVAERKVEVGLRREDGIQILSGLKPGDQVIRTGVLQLRPGMPVEVVPSDT